MTSDKREIADAIADAITDDATLIAFLESIPERVEKTVEGFVPVLTGETKASITVTSRKTPIKSLKLGRRVKLGSVHSDDDPQKVAAIEYGRSPSDEHGGTPEFAPFRKATAVWIDRELHI